jgi:spermidine/putrescine transport system substrate-binding protein
MTDRGDGLSKGNLTRRTILKTGGALATGVLLPMPAIIGKASPANAKDAFKGEELTVCAWSGAYEEAYKKAIVEPFNEKYGTKAATLGGWDQMVAQIKAAPADKPPFDVTIADEYTTVAALAENLFAKTDRAKLTNLSAVQPWYFDTRPKSAQDYGAPFGLGFLLPLVNTELVGEKPLTWNMLWDKDLEGKLALDAGAFIWLLGVAALVRKAQPGLEELYSWKPDMSPDPIFEKIEQLRPAKWYRDGAELNFVMVQEQAAVAEIYSTDALGIIKDNKAFKTSIPADGTIAYTEWYVKVRGTQHDELSDVFLNYILDKETQDRFLTLTMSVVSRNDVAVPSHWIDYPATNEDLKKRVALISMEGWERLLPHFEALDARFKQAVLKTSGG